MLLKEIPGLLPTLAGSAITKSKLWDKEVSEIHPVQLVAVRKKTLMNDPNSNIDQEISFLIQHVLYAKLDDLCDSPLLDYFQDHTEALTTTEFVSGLKRMPPIYRMALLFGMEMELSAIRVANLTVQQAHRLSNLTELAQGVLRSSVLSTKTIHMFWRVSSDSEHVALDDLNEVVYGAYGRSWTSIGTQYKRMVADHYNPIIFGDDEEKPA